MEKRQAPDQEWYTQDDFNAFYGDAGPQAWESARREGAAGEAAQGGTPDVTAAALESVLGALAAAVQSGGLDLSNLFNANQEPSANATEAFQSLATTQVAPPPPAQPGQGERRLAEASLVGRSSTRGVAS